VEYPPAGKDSDSVVLAHLFLLLLLLRALVLLVAFGELPLRLQYYTPGFIAA
jgi:hypothetical protein